MSNQGKKVIGVWMDSNHAFVISTPDGHIGDEYAVVKKIDRDDHEDEKYKNERFELSKEKQELKKYYKEITKEIEGVDRIYIFGPGKTQEELKNILKDNHIFNSKEIVLGTSDKMSTNQMVARVHAYFEGN